jgi:hypothetical protein
MKLDITLAALLKHAKDSTKDNDWRSVADTLAPIYHNEMRLMDVVSIVTCAYLKARDECRFQMPWDKGSAIGELVLSPVKSHETFMQTISCETSYTVETYYNRMLSFIMSQLMQTRIDWLTPDFTEEKQQPVITNTCGIDTTASNIKPDTFVFGSTNGVPVIKINGNGTIVWNGKDVEGDDEFKKAMLELRDLLSTLK